jgi:hypothetical protein
VREAHGAERLVHQPAQLRFDLAHVRHRGAGRPVGRRRRLRTPSLPPRSSIQRPGGRRRSTGRGCV